MVRKVFCSSVIAAAALFAGQAAAADLPVKAPYRTAAPAFTWTGFYLGANVGYGWGSGDGTITVAGFGTGPVSGSAHGILGGGQIGYNMQTGPIVFGIEADIQGSGAKGNVTATAPGWAMVATEKNPWFGTIRGRLGYAFDRMMIYATGGGLYGDAKLSGVTTASGAFSSSTTYWTWVVGGGLEQMFLPRWSVKFEYLYAGTPDRAPTPPLTTALTGNAHANIVRVGINYHF